MRSVPILGLALLFVVIACQLAGAASCPVAAKYFFLNSMGAKNGSALYQVTVEASKKVKAGVVLDLFGDSNQKIGMLQSREAEFTDSQKPDGALPPRQVMLSFVWPLANITSVKVAEVRDAAQPLPCESTPVSLNPPGVVQGSWQFDDGAQRGGTATAEIIAPLRILLTGRPEYPEYSKERDQQGIVYVATTVGVSGKVLATWVNKSSGFPLLDQASLRAARNMILTPAKTGEGDPTVATLVIEFVFTLD